MMNTCVIVGFIKDEPLMTREDGQIKCLLKVETDRPFRESSGKMETDVFNVRVWRGIADEMKSICHPGMLVAIKGRLVADKETNQCGIIAEHLSFPGRARTKNVSI